MQRGEVWWARLPEPSGAGAGFARPVIIVQADAFNRSAIRTVIAVAITSNTALAAAPGNVLLSRRASGLRRASVANVSQVVTLDRRLLAERVRALPARELDAVEQGLRLALGP